MVKVNQKQFRRNIVAVLVCAFVAGVACADTDASARPVSTDGSKESNLEQQKSYYAARDMAPLSSLKELKGLDANGLVSMNLSESMGLRLKAMHEAALILGAQKGFAERMRQLKTEIERESSHLDVSFDFRRIMTLATNDGSETYVLPPVIEAAKNAISVENEGNMLQVSGRVYKIHQHARLVTAPPDWRTFLFTDGDFEAKLPPSDLLPQDSDERKLWSEWVEDGWAAGIEQADAEVTVRVRRMARDFIGMVRYMELVEVGKVNPPIVAVTNYDVVGGGDEMRERESLYRMTMPASFNPDASEWQFIELDPRGAIMPAKQHKKIK